MSIGGQENGARTDIRQTRTDLGDDAATLSEKTTPLARMNRAVGTAGQTVRAHPMPVATGALALAGATATALLARRRADKARTARTRALAGPWFRR